MIPPETRRLWQETLHRQVGGFFTNTVRGRGLCAVCSGPASADLCYQCADHRAQREAGKRNDESDQAHDGGLRPGSA